VRGTAGYCGVTFEPRTFPRGDNKRTIYVLYVGKFYEGEPFLALSKKIDTLNRSLEISPNASSLLTLPGVLEAQGVGTPST
jgi:hypothetical protein